MALSTAGHVAQNIFFLASFFSCRSPFLFFSFSNLHYSSHLYCSRRSFHTRLRLNASPRIGTSVAVELNCTVLVLVLRYSEVTK
jgi:hypothetical protein